MEQFISFPAGSCLKDTRPCQGWRFESGDFCFSFPYLSGKIDESLMLSFAFSWREKSVFKGDLGSPLAVRKFFWAGNWSLTLQLVYYGYCKNVIVSQLLTFSYHSLYLNFLLHLLLLIFLKQEIFQENHIIHRQNELFCEAQNPGIQQINLPCKDRV